MHRLTSVLPILLLALPANADELIIALPTDAADIEAARAAGADLWSADREQAYFGADDETLTRLREAGLAVEILGAAPPLPPPDMEQYRDVEQTLARLAELAAEGAGTLLDLAQAVDGGEVKALVMGRGQTEVLIVGTHHAREWIALEVPLRMLEKLHADDGIDPEVTWILDQTRITLLPLLNPDGYAYSHDGHFMWRKNRAYNADGTRGVDPNRNYDINHCGIGSSTITTDDTYCGPAPFSEPETAALRDLVLASDFQGAVSYHSFSQYVMYPWGWTHDTADDAEAMWRIAFAMSERIEAVHGVRYRPMPSSELYLSSGDMCDWFYAVTGKPGITIELRPEAMNVTVGFSLPDDEIEPTFEENWAAMKWWLTRLAADGSDGDHDGDGVTDHDDLCPSTFDPDQADIDLDGVGDECDPLVGDRQPPTAPQRLRVVDQGVGWVELAWDPSTDRGGSGIQNYALLRSSEVVGRTEETTYRDEGGRPGRTYLYFARCYDGAGNRSADSQLIQVTRCEAEPCSKFADEIVSEVEPDAEADAGLEAEPAREHVPRAADDGGCGCGSAFTRGSGVTGPALFVLLLALRRRRH